jgi:hypothetical protein
MPDDRDSRIAVQAAEMLRISRIRERHKVLTWGAMGCFGAGILGGAVSTWIALVLLSISGVMFIQAGRDAIAGGDVVAPVSTGDYDDDVDTAALEQMPAGERAVYVKSAGRKLIGFGVVVLLMTLLALALVVARAR